MNGFSIKFALNLEIYDIIQIHTYKQIVDLTLCLEHLNYLLPKIQMENLALKINIHNCTQRIVIEKL